MRRGVWTFTIQAPGFESVQLSRELASVRPNAPLEITLKKGQGPPPPPPLAGVRGSDVQAEIDRAEASASAGDLDGAITAYQTLLGRVPALTSVYLRIGDLYERKADGERALEAYRRLATLEPGNTTARDAIARLTREK